MLELILFSNAQSPDLGLFDDLLFRKKWFIKDLTIKKLMVDLAVGNKLLPDKCFLMASPDNKQKKGFRVDKIYKTHDSLGRPIPKRDANGKFLKKLANDPNTV